MDTYFYIYLVNPCKILYILSVLWFHVFSFLYLH